MDDDAPGLGVLLLVAIIFFGYLWWVLAYADPTINKWGDTKASANQEQPK